MVKTKRGGMYASSTADGCMHILFLETNHIVRKVFLIAIITHPGVIVLMPSMA